MSQLVGRLLVLLSAFLQVTNIMDIPYIFPIYQIYTSSIFVVSRIIFFKKVRSGSRIFFVSGTSL